MLVKLRDGSDSALSRPITEEEGSWVVAMPFLSGVLANLFTGHLLDTIGRRYCFILSCVPRIVMVLLYLYAKELWLLLVARFLSGILDSVAFTTVSIYASEIASKEVRGSLGGFLQIYCSFGICLSLGIGPFVSYTTLNIIFLAITVASSVLLLLLPDSPYFLYSKGKTDDARKLLLKLRGSDIKANDEIKEYQIASSNEVGKVTIPELLRNKLFLKGAAICVFLGFSSQANGYTAVFQYLQTILETTNTSVRPEISSVIIGGIQMFASLCTTLVTDRFGRKFILISTVSGMVIGFICLGAFFKVTEEQEQIIGFMNYLPLASIILIVFCHSSGIASIMWILISEIFEGRTRAIGASLAILVATLTGFGVSKSIPSLTSSIGPTMTYWLFSIICILVIMFTAIFIPETKGRSFAEIQAILGNKSDVENSEKDKDNSEMDRSC
ncbi:facilitated trehalose transporter Tret1-like isoform X2 [Plodia interpunctella]|nr:facilitated trehalose transporter Tret1-like isoform X2 [Plodia interpunctella]XP_053619780.1 facilitated trehalose transporter Tret1-like isoform X2 [Plodia interpunctella]XP_053619781.1 facilitated trehalose transporter Tret1-like isoform X2 [Plodia interpunctella]